MKNQVYNWNDLRRLRAEPLEKKIERAKELIGRALKESKRPAVACSWGKDSMAVLHMVLEQRPDALVLYQNTGVTFHETLRYRDMMLKEWNIKNYTETKPIMTFWECVKKFGYPQFRRMEGGSGAPKCCFYLKEEPGRLALKEYEIDTEFVGIQASESMIRRLSYFREGDYYYSKQYGCYLVRPIATWDDNDVWAYHKKVGIPYCKLYDDMKRNGCMPCTGFKEWRKILRKVNPRMYEFVTKQMGQPTLSEYEVEDK